MTFLKQLYHAVPFFIWATILWLLVIGGFIAFCLLTVFLLGDEKYEDK